MAVAKAIKEALPQTKVAAFGVYFTMLEKQGLENYPFLDFALVGEPEDTLDELLAALAADAAIWRPSAAWLGTARQASCSTPRGRSSKTSTGCRFRTAVC